MVSYNPKGWFSLIFKFHKSDTFRMLFWAMLCMALYAWLIAYIEIRFFDLEHTNANVVHSVIGFVISLLLVFRINSAYDRWWEGRKLWGALVNNTRNLALKLSVFIPETEVQYRRSMATDITNYVFAVREHLRSGVKNDLLDLSELGYAEAISINNHIPNYIARRIFEKLNAMYRTGIITGDHLIVLNAEAGALTDIVGACERIKNTPIPFSYSMFLKKFIFIYIMSLPFGLVAQLGYWMIPTVVLVFYVILSLEIISEEIEDPFGNDANDLPTTDLSERIKSNVFEIFSLT